MRSQSLDGRAAVPLPSGFRLNDRRDNADNPSVDEARLLRQRALEQLAILGTPAEERFDRLTRLARQALDVPIANVTLLDGDNLFMKSSDGYDSLALLAAEESFCAHGVNAGEPLVVPNAAQDERFARLDAVLGVDHVRAYAGMPLTDDNGIAVGMFCVADTKPRKFSERQLSILAELTSMAQEELITCAETDRARAVQQRLLPRELPTLDGYEIAAMCRPTHSVGGDFYDFGEVGGGVGLVLADVMGKGTAAAIVSATVRAAIQSALRGNMALAVRERHSDPKAVVANVVLDTAHAVRRDLDETDTLVTAFLAHIDPVAHRLSWVDAGHGLAVVVRADGDEWLAGTDLPLGVDATIGWVGQAVDITPGDTVVVFSDGLLDLFGGSAVAMHEIVELARSSATVEQLVGDVCTLTSFGVPTDDVTVVALRRSA